MATRNGFLILVHMRDASDISWAYHYGANEEGKAKKAFARLVADELREAVAITIEKFQSGAFSVPGRKDTFCADIGVLRLLFMPTEDMGDYAAVPPVRPPAEAK